MVGNLAVRRAGQGVAAAVVLAAGLAVGGYANTLANGLVYDDHGVITLNPAVRDAGDWRRILLTPSWFAALSREHRPLTTWTFALNHALHGTSPLGYHLVNVLAHACVSALVVVLAVRLGASTGTATMAGALFAVHPIHTEAVASVVGRAELLAAGFALLSLLAVCRAEVAARRWPATVVAVVAYGLGLASKEHVVALLALVPLAHLLVTDEGAVGTFAARLRGHRLALYGGLVVVTAGYLVLRWWALGELVGGHGGFATIPFWQNPAASAGWWSRWLTALFVQARAIGLLLLPVGLSADYSYRQIPVVESMTSLAAALGVLGMTALLTLALMLWRWRRRRLLFWLALAWLTYLPVSNLPFPIGTIFAERLLYLPSVGFCVLVAVGLGGRPAARWVGAVLVAGALLLTSLRNPVWRDDLTLATATLAAAPESTQAHHIMGSTYARLGRDQDALDAFEQALAIYPENVNPLYNGAVILYRNGRVEDARGLFARVTELNPRHPGAWAFLASIHNAEGRFADALAAADRALALRPGLERAETARGAALKGLRQPAASRPPGAGRRRRR